MAAREWLASNSVTLQETKFELNARVPTGESEEALNTGMALTDVYMLLFVRGPVVVQTTSCAQSLRLQW